jgi:hypothetical protein
MSQVSYSKSSIPKDWQMSFAGNVIGPISLLGYSFRLFQLEFKRVFLSPFVWNLLYIALPAFFISSTFIYRLSFDQQISSTYLRLFDASPDKTEKILELFSLVSQNYNVTVFVLTTILAALYIYSIVIYYRGLFLLNDSSIKNLWLTPKHLMVSVIRIIISSLFLSVITSLLTSFLPDVLGQTILQYIIQIIWFTLLGLSELVILFEQQTVFESFVSSFKICRRYIVTILLRWTIFYGFFLLILTSLSLMIGILFSVTAAYFQSTFVLGLIGLVFIFIITTVWFVYQSMFKAFFYLSFLNLKLLKKNHLS